MKGIYIEEYGGLDALQWREDLPVPSPGEGEVLVKVHAAGFNYAETRIREGRFGLTTDPIVTGLEGAGEIVELGRGVEGWAVGDRVFGRAHGTQAQFAVFAAEDLFAIPENLSFEEAAGIPVGWLTTWHALHTVLDTQPGERLLVEAVASSVGVAGVQLGVLRGNWVAGTASSVEKAAKAADLGASLTIDYLTEDVDEKVRAATDGHGIDAALVSIGGSTAESTIASIAYNGRLALFGSTGGMEYGFSLGVGERNIVFYSFSLDTHPGYRPVTVPTFREQVLPRFADGTLRVPIAEVIPLREIARAHEAVPARQHFGKIILSVPHD